MGETCFVVMVRETAGVWPRAEKVFMDGGEAKAFIDDHKTASERLARSIEEVPFHGDQQAIEELLDEAKEQGGL